MGPNILMLMLELKKLRKFNTNAKNQFTHVIIRLLGLMKNLWLCYNYYSKTMHFRNSKPLNLIRASIISV